MNRHHSLKKSSSNARAVYTGPLRASSCSSYVLSSGINKSFVPPCDQEPIVNQKQHFYDCVQWPTQHSNEQLEYDLYSNHLQNQAKSAELISLDIKKLSTKKL